MKLLRPLRRRLGQGMTEYIIIVGLVAILLIFTVRQYSAKLDVTIQGTTSRMEREASVDDGATGGTGGTGGTSGGATGAGMENTGLRHADTGAPVYKDAGGNYFLEDGVTPVDPSKAV